MGEVEQIIMMNYENTHTRDACTKVNSHYTSLTHHEGWGGVIVISKDLMNAVRMRVRTRKDEGQVER